MKDFLKRFQKLENQPTDWSVKPESMPATKRFEKLEINDRKIEVAISDRAAAHETAPTGTNYIRMCPYCGAENSSSSRECAQCRHALSEYYNDYGGQEGQLKKCVCGALNLKERKFCWVCGRDFSLSGDSQVVPRQENVIVLTIDGQTYRSTDAGLPPGIVRCASTGSCGAGAITGLAPMLMSPIRRVDESTSGGGAIAVG